MDDVTHTSLGVDPEFDVESEDVVRAVFFGLGADGKGLDKIRVTLHETALARASYEGPVRG